MFGTKRRADISWLFETKALAVSPADKPFWYTSGLIGPYYINTHFLCGGKETAQDVLEFIDLHHAEKTTFPHAMLARLQEVYSSHKIYRATIDAMVELVRDSLPIEELGFVSGGQRRDWFFAPLVASKLDIPCLYIYNDLSIVDQEGIAVTDLAGAKILNVADLLTVGSSYTKKWIPALAEVNAVLEWSLSGVDRCQGGEDNLKESGVSLSLSLFSIESALIEAACKEGLIDDSQFSLVKGYLDDPFASMQSFLKNNPQFLDEARSSSDEKKKARANLLVEQDLYQLNIS